MLVWLSSGALSLSLGHWLQFVWLPAISHGLSVRSVLILLNYKPFLFPIFSVVPDSVVVLGLFLGPQRTKHSVRLLAPTGKFSM